MPEPTSQASAGSALPRARFRAYRLALLAVLFIAAVAVTFAQRSGFPGTRQRQQAGMVDRGGTPEWEVNKELPKDIFTFVRIQVLLLGWPLWWWRLGWPPLVHGLSRC